jgi:membrane protease YdiL (CAAX protease family)
MRRLCHPWHRAGKPLDYNVNAVSSPAGSPTIPWNLSRNGVVAVATLLTLVALAENMVAPWAPFHIVYAALATLLPLAWGTWSFGRLSTVRRSSWALVVFFPVVLLAGVSLWRLLGVDSATAAGPFFSLSAALPALFGAGGARLGWPADRVQWFYLAFVVLWAGLGEELFYRGYMHGTLRRRIGPLRAAVVSSAFFAIRHATQLALVKPYPAAAALSWVAFSFVVGLVLAWLYDRCASLWPPVLAHYLFNLIPMAALAFS